jgi:simple sugar transport system permease protein
MKRSISFAVLQRVGAAGVQQIKKRAKEARYRLVRYPEIGAMAAFLVVFLGFALTAKHFLTPAAFAGMLAVIAELGIVTMGITLLMISGEFDLSVGSVLAVSSMSFALLLRANVPALLALGLALTFAALLGLINGLIVVTTGIPSFITTLGTMMFWRGILLAITGGLPIAYFGKSVVFEVLNSRFIGDFRTSAIWFALIVLIFYFILQHTPYGNWAYATGGNKEAAWALGVPTKRVKLINFVLSGLLAGLAGCIQFGRFISVDALRGQGVELEAIAAAVTGGVLLSGGYGSIIGALLGVLIVGMIRTGLVLAGAPAYWYQAFVGTILIVAVIINIRTRGGSR